MTYISIFGSISFSLSVAQCSNHKNILSWLIQYLEETDSSPLFYTSQTNKNMNIQLSHISPINIYTYWTTKSASNKFAIGFQQLTQNGVRFSHLFLLHTKSLKNCQTWYLSCHPEKRSFIFLSLSSLAEYAMFSFCCRFFLPSFALLSHKQSHTLAHTYTRTQATKTKTKNSRWSTC